MPDSRPAGVGGSGGDAAGAFDDRVPVVDVAVDRVDHHVLHARFGIVGDAGAQLALVFAVPVGPQARS